MHPSLGPHEGNELELMLQNKKELAFFIQVVKYLMRLIHTLRLGDCIVKRLSTIGFCKV